MNGQTGTIHQPPPPLTPSGTIPKSSVNLILLLFITTGLRVCGCVWPQRNAVSFLGYFKCQHINVEDLCHLCKEGHINQHLSAAIADN